MIDQPRSTQRYQPKKPENDRALTNRLHQISSRHPRYGYRRAAALLRRKGREVNAKRVHRLWKQAGLQVPQRQRKRRRIGSGQDGSVRLHATHPNHVWSYDFVFDQTEDGRTLKFMPVVDECTRECLALVVGRSITSAEVVRTLDRLICQRGEPGHVRSDNGPEFVAEAVRTYLKEQGAKTRYIDPGAPWQNPYVESFNGKLHGRTLGPRDLRKPPRRPGACRAVSPTLQSAAAPQRTRLSDPGGLRRRLHHGSPQSHQPRTRNSSNIAPGTENGVRSLRGALLRPPSPTRLAAWRTDLL